MIFYYGFGPVAQMASSLAGHPDSNLEINSGQNPRTLAAPHLAFAPAGQEDDDLGLEEQPLSDTTNSAPANDDKIASTATMNSSTLQTFPAERGGGSGTGFESFIRAVDSISASNGHSSYEFDTAENFAGGIRSDVITYGRSAYLAAGTECREQNTDMKLSLVLSILETRLSYIPEVQKVGGVRAIPCIKVPLMLTTDLDPDEDKVKATLDLLLIREIDFTGSLKKTADEQKLHGAVFDTKWNELLSEYMLTQQTPFVQQQIRKPCVHIVSLNPSQKLMSEVGDFLQGEWKPDSSLIALMTQKNCVVFIKVEVDSSAPNHHCLYVMQEGSFLSVRDELVVATIDGCLNRLRWTCNKNERATLHFKDIPVSADLQQFRAARLSHSDSHVVEMEYSPTLGGYSMVLSSGRAVFVIPPSSRAENVSAHGVWAQEMNAAATVAINHRYRLIAFGCHSGEGVVYHLDEAVGSLEVSHKLVISSKEFPDAGHIAGSLTCMKWTSDGTALAMVWKNGGLSLWSVFGSLLLCTLGGDYSALTDGGQLFPPPVISMEWGLEGYHLWMVTADQEDYVHCSPLSSSKEGSTASEGKETTRQGGIQNQQNKTDEGSNKKFSAQILQFQLVKSALTVNPCMVKEDLTWILPSNGSEEVPSKNIVFGRQDFLNIYTSKPERLRISIVTVKRIVEIRLKQEKILEPSLRDSFVVYSGIKEGLANKLIFLVISEMTMIATFETEHEFIQVTGSKQIGFLTTTEKPNTVLESQKIVQDKTGKTFVCHIRMIIDYSVKEKARQDNMASSASAFTDLVSYEKYLNWLYNVKAGLPITFQLSTILELEEHDSLCRCLNPNVDYLFSKAQEFSMNNKFCLNIFFIFHDLNNLVGLSFIGSVSGYQGLCFTETNAILINLLSKKKILPLPHAQAALAHEIAHSLGVTHNKSSFCPSNNSIMGEYFSRKQNAYNKRLNPCDIEIIQNYIRDLTSLNQTCLKELQNTYEVQKSQPFRVKNKFFDIKIIATIISTVLAVTGHCVYKVYIFLFY